MARLMVTAGVLRVSLAMTTDAVVEHRARRREAEAEPELEAGSIERTLSLEASSR